MKYDTNKRSIIFAYENLLLGRSQRFTEGLFDDTKTIESKRKIAGIIWNYAITYYLGWTAKEADLYMTAEIAQKLLLNKVYKQIDLDPTRVLFRDFRFILQYAFPGEIKYDIKEEAISEYERTAKIIELNNEYSCILLTGARQVGKSTLFKSIMEELGISREVVTLDDFEERSLAKNDPAMFLQIHDTPLMIDEVQYAPELFSYIKIAIDNGADPGSFWLTGSQTFRLMELAQESLAGRVAILRLPPLSQHEAYGTGENLPFSLDLNSLKSRKKTHTPATLNEIYERIWKGSMPALLSGKFSDRDIYYSSYLQTYIERDVSELIKGVDKLVFQDFIRAAACRIGEVLNIHAMADDLGISDDTAKRWIRVLERSDVITLLRPYRNNALHRTIKTPKLYFFDTGLVAFLTKYSSPEILANGALSGHIIENYAVMEIIKSYSNAAKEPLFWYYRDKDNKEVDMIIESDGVLHPIEIKRSVNPGTELIRAFNVLERSTVPKGVGGIICMRPDLSAINSENLIIPIWYI